MSKVERGGCLACYPTPPPHLISAHLTSPLFSALHVYSTNTPVNTSPECYLSHLTPLINCDFSSVLNESTLLVMLLTSCIPPLNVFHRTSHPHTTSRVLPCMCTYWKIHFIQSPCHPLLTLNLHKECQAASTSTQLAQNRKFHAKRLMQFTPRIYLLFVWPSPCLLSFQWVSFHLPFCNRHKSFHILQNERWFHNSPHAQLSSNMIHLDVCHVSAPYNQDVSHKTDKKKSLKLINQQMNHKIH